MPKGRPKGSKNKSTVSESPEPTEVAPAGLVSPTVNSAAALFRQLAVQKGQELFGGERGDVSGDASELDSNFQYLYVPDLMHQCALGRVGYVLGRVKIVVGDPGASKSSSLYFDCNLALEQGGLALIVALEDADSTEHIKAYVRQHENLIIWKAKTLQQGFKMCFEAQRLFAKVDPDNKLPKVLGFDSIAGGTEEDQVLELDEEGEEFEEDPDAEKQRPGGLGKIMKAFFNTMKASISQTNTLFVVLNQARENIYTGRDATFQNRKPLRDRLALTGGKAQRFVASYFEFIQKGRTSKELGNTDDETDAKISTGFETTVDWIKNKPRIPDRKITRAILYGHTFQYHNYTVATLAANKICGLTVKAKRYWCEKIGIPEAQKMTAAQIYPIIHAPGNIELFQKELDILGPTVPQIGAKMLPPTVVEQIDLDDDAILGRAVPEYLQAAKDFPDAAPSGPSPGEIAAAKIKEVEVGNFLSPGEITAPLS